MDNSNPPKVPTDSVILTVDALVTQIRLGKYEEACRRFSSVYEAERTHPANAALLLKHWAAALACQGDYTTAIRHYRQAALLFTSIGNNIESWACEDSAVAIEQREQLPVEFNQFIRNASGGSLEYPRNYL